VARFWVSVVSGDGVGCCFSEFIRGGSVEEVTDVFLAFVYDDIGGHMIGRMQERLGEERWAAFSATATEAGFSEFTGFF
jgi:hypothetical protein